jgi:hypothetical protein
VKQADLLEMPHKHMLRIVDSDGTLAYAGMVTTIARRYFTSKEDVEDIVGDIYLKLAKGDAERFDGRCRPSSYIGQMTVNHCIDILKFKGRRVQLLPFIKDHGDSPSEPDITESLLNLFDDPVRRWLRMHYVEGWSYEDLARLENIPRNTLTSRIFRAIKRVGPNAEECL